MKLASLLLALMLVSLPPIAAGAEVSTAPGDQVDPLATEAAGGAAFERARARELRQQADAARQAAEARYKADQNACYAKFLVSACLDDAKKTRTAAIIAARKPDAEAREIERRLRRQEADEREARRQQEGPRHEREAQEQAARNKAEQEEAMRRIERKQADKARASGAP